MHPDFGIYLTYAESIKSATAIRRGIDNTPGAEQYANIKRLYDAVYKPLCEHFGFKLPVSSLFRSVALNKAIGGSATSDHRNGNAIDIDMDNSGRKLTNRALFEYVRDNLDFDQLIWEYGNSSNPDWVHISYRGQGNNRNQVKTIE
jgi:hypothetical protein